MQKIKTELLGIDQGEEQVFSDFEIGGDMWVSEGQRERRLAVSFTEPFSAPPVVQVGLALWDFGNSANIRADILAENVTRTGFDLVFKTWQDTRVARARLNWIAFGAVDNEDAWDV